MLISVITPSIRPKGLAITQACLAKQSLKDFEWLTEISIPEKGHDLNASYNRMLRRAKGELVVSLQDYIRIPENGLELFWEAYQNNKDTFFTAPVGKTIDWVNVKWDWRTSNAGRMDWTMWEADWASAPLEALKKIGGFDEELDKYWSFDNVNVGLRAEMAGYKFDCLHENKAVAYDHDKDFKHPFRQNYNPPFHNNRLDEIRRGLKFDYIN